MCETFRGSTLNAVGGDDCVTRQPLISRVWETCKGNARVTPTETIEAHEVIQAGYTIVDVIRHLAHACMLLTQSA